MTDRAALAAKLRWAYPRGPSHVTQEEWRIVLAALEAAPERETLDDCLALVRRLKEFRAHRDIECGELPFNICDYYAFDDLEERLARLGPRSDAEVKP